MAQIQVKLQLIREVTNYVVAKDEAGVERWLDKRKVPVTVTGQLVDATVDAKKWQRRLLTTVAVVKPVKSTATRKCLACGKQFPKTKWIFVCNSCKSTEEWASGDVGYGVMV